LTAHNAETRCALLFISIIMMAGMCRSIKTLRRPEQTATRDEISAAALQFVRKVSGFRQPSRVNQVAFDSAVVEIGDSVEKLLDKIGALRADAVGAHAPKQ
jgi:hypothetical protein